MAELAGSVANLPQFPDILALTRTCAAIGNDSNIPEYGQCLFHWRYINSEFGISEPNLRRNLRILPISMELGACQPVFESVTTSKAIVMRGSSPWIGIVPCHI